MRKSGIVISIILLLIALLVYLFGVRGAEEGKRISETAVTTAATTQVTVAKSETVTTVGTPEETEVVMNTTAATSVESVVPSETMTEGTTTPITAEEFTVIDEGMLSDGITRETVGVITDKNIVSIKGNLYYKVTLAVLDTDEILEYMANKQGYDLLKEVMKVSVNYTKYTTDEGMSLYIVNSVSLLT